MDYLCNRKDCKEIGTHQVWLELYPSAGLYEGAPAQLFFQDLTFCERHAKEMKYQDLVYEEQIASMFHHLGRVAPDFSRTQVKTSVIQLEGIPA